MSNKTGDQAYAYAREKYELIMEKVFQHNKLLESYLKTLGTFDAKLDSLVQLLVQKGVFAEDELETLHDHNTGWRKKDATEVIVAGDVVWVDYTLTSAEVKEKVPAGFVEEKGMPIRVGAKAVIFDEPLLGKKSGDVFAWSHKDEKDTFDFNITVTKVKTKLEGAFDGELTEAGDGSDGVEVASTVESNT